MSAFALPREIPSEAAKRQRGKERFRPGGHRSTMGVAGPEPAMAGASAGSPIVPRARRAYALTAPPNLNGKKALTLKREAPTIWELQTAMAASEQVEAPTVRKLPVAPRTWGRPHSTAVESAALAESEGNMSVDCDGESRGGGSSSSWPRVRKQRTGVRNSMSLWEVSEALDGNAPQHPAVLPSPDTLDAHTLADLGDDLSFVDNMFFSHAPAPAPVSAPEDSMGMAALGALMIAPAARWGRVSPHQHPSLLSPSLLSPSLLSPSLLSGAALLSPRSPPPRCVPQGSISAASAAAPRPTARVPRSCRTTRRGRNPCQRRPLSCRCLHQARCRRHSTGLLSPTTRPRPPRRTRCRTHTPCRSQSTRPAP